MSESEKFSVDTSLAFDVGKQAAIMAWCLRDKLFCKQCSYALKQEWFSSPAVGKLFSAIMALYRQFHNVPTPEEVKAYRPFTQEDALSQKRLAEALHEALAKSQRYSLEILRSEMTEWMHAVVFAQAVQQSVLTYNSKKVKEAWEIVERATLFKASATFEDGYNKGFISSSLRILNEREERMEQMKRLLKYGTGYLDHSLGAIIPNDLIVIGASTGSGKTQLATSISLENALAGGIDGLGVPVHYFALEAEENEIERRIKYSLISAEYYGDGDENKPYISYLDWRMGRNDKLLRPFEEKLQPVLESAVKNLNTLYRTSGSFDLNSLERNLLDVVTESRLIVIDHLHYIDTDGDDENKAYKRVVKLVRDIVLHYNVPVILIAHLRKKQGGRNQHTVMPVIDDFHGTSDVPKIATTCIMMAPAWSIARNNSWQYPTYIGAVKSRLDGTRTRYAGLVQFNARTARYEQAYRMCDMSDLLSTGEFNPLAGKELPRWADPIPENDILTKGM
jgi:replicative DNA helicase